MKKILQISIFVVLFAMLCYSFAFASENGTWGNNLIWTLDDNGVLTITGTGEIDNIPYREAWRPYSSNITKVVIGDGVTSIGDEMFSWCSKLTSVELPDSLMSIGSEAFYYCDNLNSINIPNKVTSIGACAFSGTKLTEITVPRSVTSIGVSAFNSCNDLSSVIIQDGLISIGEEAFRGCSNLYSIYLPASVTNIGANAFLGCELESYYVNSGNNAFSAVDGVLFDKLQKTLVSYPTGKGSTYTVPDGVTQIGDSAFRGSKLTSITMPDSVTIIDDRAFYLCPKLQYVTFSNNLTSIGDSAFYNCLSLYDVLLPDGLNSIGAMAFAECKIESIVIPPSVTSIGYASFSNDRMARIDVDPENAVYSSVDGIVFSKSKDALICYPSAKNGAFYAIPDSVTSIGIGAFNCSNYLEKVCIPSSVNSIEDSAFEACNSLVSVIVPKSVTDIGNYVFDMFNDNLILRVEPNSYALNYAISKNLHYQIIGEQYEGTLGKLTWSLTLDNAAVLHISGTGEMPELTETDAWRPYSAEINSIVIDNGVTSIADYAFSNCIGLSSVSIPSSVSNIGSYAFAECSNITNILIPEGISSIGQWAFSNCASLTSIIIPEGMETLSDELFQGCTSLINVTLPSTLNTIGYGSFANCSNLSSFIIPDSVTYIGYRAFMNCSKLPRIDISSKIDFIGGGAFSGCKALISINVSEHNQNYCSIDGVLYSKDMTQLIACPGAATSCQIPSSVTYIIAEAFRKCTHLHRIIIPERVSEIQENCFSDCTALTDIYLPAGLTDIWRYAFENCISLSNIWYAGTEAQWSAIGKWNDWNLNTPSNLIIHYNCQTNDVPSYEPDFILPKFLQIVDTEAFEGNAFVYPIVSASVTNIGSRAFADCFNLRYIRIEGDNTRIAADAFSGVTGLTIIANEGSYAEVFANRYHYLFEKIAEMD